MDDMNNKKSSGWLIAIIIVVLLSAIGSCSNNKEPKQQSEKCGVCYETFTNSDDVHSIVMTGMCETCYKNFKIKQDAKEKIKKYNDERN
jgi:tRNA U54 and U55 pseudouridine synthase Pus10